MRDFKKLEFWEAVHKMTLKINPLSHRFRKEEIYGLTNQIRSALAAVPKNITKGGGGSSQEQLKWFCDVATDPASEVMYQLLSAKGLPYRDHESYELINEKYVILKKRLNSFIERLTAK